MATNKIEVDLTFKGLEHLIKTGVAPSFIEFAEALKLKKAGTVFDVHVGESDEGLLSNDEVDLIITSFKSVREQIAMVSLVRELKRLWEE